MKERMLALPWKRERPLFRMEYHPALELPVSSSWLWVIPNSIDNCINDSHFFFNWKHISTSLSLRLYLSRLVRNKRTGSIKEKGQRSCTHQKVESGASHWVLPSSRKRMAAPSNNSDYLPVIRPREYVLFLALYLNVLMHLKSFMADPSIGQLGTRSLQVFAIPVGTNTHTHK